MSQTEHESAPVRLAVVGHTNTGKTSLLRTLTRDGGFGEVSSRPSTTRHVEGARLIGDGRVLVEMFDTPGMEDPIALLETLDTIGEEARDGGVHLDGPARVERLLASPLASTRFEQEGKVLRQMLASDAGLYVVDARDPVLAKYRDELALLASCARPVLPVLNFVHDPANREREWREALARLGLHTVVRFDTVAPERDGEALLYGKLATVLDHHRRAFDTLVACRAREAGARKAAALRLVAELLIDVAGAYVIITEDDAQTLSDAVSGLNQQVRGREQHFIAALLKLYRFNRHDVDAPDLPLSAGRWEDELFSPETLRMAGARLGGGAAAGAAAGLGIDMMVGGLSLGAGTLIGALAGGGWQTMRHYGDRLLGKITGQRELSVDDGVLRALSVRALYLVRALEGRGHAAMEPIRQLGEQLAAQTFASGNVASLLREARARREWSALLTPPDDPVGRQDAIDRLADELAYTLPAVS